MDYGTILTPLLLSLKVAITATVVAMPLAFIGAYAITFGRFKGRFILEVLINLPLALPPVVIGYLLLVLLSPKSSLGQLLNHYHLNILFTWKAAALAALMVGFPLMVRAIKLSLSAIDPKLILAARTLGANRLDVVLSVLIPLAWPGLLAGSLMLFIRSLGEFGATMMIAGNVPGVTQTIALAIYDHANTPYHETQALALSIVSATVAIIVLAIHEYLLKAKQGGH